MGRKRMTKRWNEKDLAYYNAQRRLMTELAKAPHKPIEFTRPVVKCESPEALRAHPAI